MTGKDFRPCAGGVLCLALLLPLTLAATYLFSVYSYARELWPIETLRELKRWADPPRPNIGQYDRLERLIAYPNKTEVPCSAPTATTALILAIGQSNAANDAEKKVSVAKKWQRPAGPRLRMASGRFQSNDTRLNGRTWSPCPRPPLLSSRTSLGSGIFCSRPLARPRSPASRRRRSNWMKHLGY